MNNTENKNKVVLKKMIKKQFFITVITSFFLLFIVIGSSYSVFSSKTETGLTDVVVQSGNLLASISSTSETIEMNYETLGVSDEVGLSYEPYTFTVKNNGQNLIKYYELRIVDKEYGNSTLPHKAINYSLSKNGEDYTEPQNLGDNRSYIYVGGSLAPGESDTFNLKLWVNEEFGKYANNKEINASIEITLYSDIPTRNYINYDTQGGSYIPKTSTASKRVTNQIPLKGGYSFVGWSTTSNGNVEYESNAIYEGNNGITLYAIWEPCISYNLNGGDGNIPSNSINSGITTLVPIKNGYLFLGWATTPTAEEAEYQSGDSYNGDGIMLYAVWQKIEYLYDRLEKTLISNLTEPDVDGNKYVYGNEINNNYVSYSGKLWRIVSLNSDGTIKLITEDVMTQMAWNANDNIDYSSSQIRNWLNNEFLPTINDSFIVEKLWDYTTYSTFSNEKIESDLLITDKVGLITLYEYVKTGGSEYIIYDNSFLSNNNSFWLLTPKGYIYNAFSDELNGFVWTVSNENYVAAGSDLNYGIMIGGVNINQYGVRPVINLKLEIQFFEGEGTVLKPYKIIE